MADTAHDIFLSYDRGESPFVRAVADELRLQGVDSWFHDGRLLAGSSWLEETADALASSKVVVVFIGATRESPWVNFEIGAAVGREKRVLPVFLTEDAAKRGAPSVLSNLVGIDAHNRKPDEVARQIVEAISERARP